MDLKSQVTSVENSNTIRKLLDGIGVRLPSVFYRDYTGSGESDISAWPLHTPEWCEDNIPCYTVSELGRILQGVPDEVIDKLPADLLPESNGKEIKECIFDPDFWAMIIIHQIDCGAFTKDHFNHA